MKTGVVVTSYCKQRHRLSDGAPIEHQCRQLPPECLKAEQEGDIEGMLALLDTHPLELSKGETEEPMKTDADEEAKQ